MNSHSSPMQYPVLVTCGSDSERRNLLQVLDPEEKYPSKALLPFLGKRIIDWQLEALRASPYVKDIYLLGLNADLAPFDFPVHYVPCKTTSPLPEKLKIGLEYLQSQGQEPSMVVISTSDTPSVTTQSINSFFESLSQLHEYDAIISCVPIDITEEIFPNPGRAVAYLKDHQIYPGEMFGLTPKAIIEGQKIIAAMASRRRKINRQVKNISLGPILRYIARKPVVWPMIVKYLQGTLSLAETEETLTSAFGLRLKTVIIPDPGFGMDIDLPEDYERMKAYVRERKFLSGE